MKMISNHLSESEIGGLISAMLLTLFAHPALYLVFNGDERQRTPLPARRQAKPVGEEVEVH